MDGGFLADARCERASTPGHLTRPEHGDTFGSRGLQFALCCEACGRLRLAPLAEKTGGVREGFSGGQGTA